MKPLCLSATGTVSQRPVKKSVSNDVIASSPDYKPAVQPSASDVSQVSTTTVMKSESKSNIITTTAQLGQEKSYK